MLKQLIEEQKIKTKPNGQSPTIHTLRKSAAMFLLNQGYSIDQVKAFLGHKPSSDAIDVYVNYRGLKFEPEVTKVQTDELLKLQQTIKDNEKQSTIMQQQMDLMQGEMAKIISRIDTKEHINKELARRMK